MIIVVIIAHSQKTGHCPITGIVVIVEEVVEVVGARHRNDYADIRVYDKLRSPPPEEQRRSSLRLLYHFVVRCSPYYVLANKPGPGHLSGRRVTEQ